MVRFGNPFSFTPAPVTFFTSIVYVALFAALIFNHTILPSAPSRSPKGIDLNAAWADLQHLTSSYHPYNSRANNDARKYLLDRIYGILKENKAEYATESDRISGIDTPKNAGSVPVLVIDDLASNVTSSSDNLSVYFEGSNIIVSIKGTQSNGHCYQEVTTEDSSSDKGGVLVNAHFDSVSTGYGATDDGVGVVTVLQLLKYFTASGNEPKRCIVLLLNNGEEDYLNGARAFMRHPVSQTTHVFLNLEGAGAGGRAALFRSTDTEVTRFYRQAKYPFGTVLFSDGFKSGLIRSQTDYVVFNGDLGLRGLDVAFTEPRAKYHTYQDSTSETSKEAVWHMLSGALATVKALASDTSDKFSGKPHDGQVGAGKGSRGVWFDLFGLAFAVFELHTLFAWSVTLLVFTPILFIVLTIFLSRADKNYMFARRGWVHSTDDDHYISFNGWRGFFRYPITFAVATAGIVALAYLYAKVNPLIVYSSEYSVWSSMIAAWLFIAWLGLRGTDAMRPTALQRHYSLLWIYIGGFALVVLATVSENNWHLAGGYFVVIHFGTVSAALFLSYLEMFALPKKSGYVALMDSNEPASRPATSGTQQGQNEHGTDGQNEESTETTSLLRGNRQSFARYGARRESQDDGTNGSGDGSLPPGLDKAYGKEQAWSSSLPGSVWLLQFLILGPLNIILVGQIALPLTAALHQTGADGSSMLTVYLFIAGLAVFLLLPISPFLHRFHYHIPTFFLLVLIGTLAYNILAFPFSANNKLKLFFLQRVDCDSGTTSVSLTGAHDFVQVAASQLPSTTGKDINCTSSGAYLGARNGLTSCIWPGLPAHPVPLPAPNSTTMYHNRHKSYESTWFSFTASRTSDSDNDFRTQHAATFQIRGENTRNCRIYFDTPISHLSVEGAAADERFAPVSDKGTREVRLWNRDHGSWNVSVGWDEPRDTSSLRIQERDEGAPKKMTFHGLVPHTLPEVQHEQAETRAPFTAADAHAHRLPSTTEDGPAHADKKKDKDKVPLTGSVVCLWADANTQGAIPAFEEVGRFLPVWAVVTKAGDGLVEGWKGFEV